MTLSGKNFIGKDSFASGSNHFMARDPSSMKNLEVVFTEATSKEVNMAVDKAESIYHVYKNISNSQRAHFLETIAKELLALEDILIVRCMQETALPETRLKGELMRTANQLKLFASVAEQGSWVDARIDTAIPDRQPIPKADIRQVQIPMGPVGIFGASNFPLAFSVAGGDTASALAAGCPVIFKAHPLHPGTSELAAKAILKATHATNMPDGVFSLVHGRSTQVGMTLTMHPSVTSIGFTGSFAGGKALFDAANKRPIPIPVFAEMGSSNPVFILPDALKERTESLASGMIASVNLGVGQFCTNPGVFILQKSKEALQLIDNMQKLVSASIASTMLSESIKNNYEKGVSKLSDHEAVELIANGMEGRSENQAQTKLFQTTGQQFINNLELASEVFGPSTVIVLTKDQEEVVQIAQNLEGHLTTTIHGTETDLLEHSELIEILERKAGRLIFNGFPTGVEVCHSMVHGGPYPATTATQSTSVGTGAIRRFSRPVCFQDFPQSSLPAALQDGNPLQIWRTYNGEIGKL